MGLNDFVGKFIDPYDRPARLYPGLLVFAPVAVLLVCLYGKDNILTSSILSVLGFCGVAYALSRIARDAGKRLQDDLFQKWGGAPTTQLLRHRDSRIDIHTKERFHSIISKGLGKRMPSPESESADPQAADELYRAATMWLIDKTRDKKTFPLVFKELVAFGFHRNVLGLRLPGVLLTVVSIVWVLLHTQVLSFVPPYWLPRNALNFPPPVLITLGVSTVMLFAWGILFSESALKRVGFSYAERLLQSCDRIRVPANKKVAAAD